MHIHVYLVPEAIFFLSESIAIASEIVSSTPPSSHVATTAYGRSGSTKSSACQTHDTDTDTDTGTDTQKDIDTEIETDVDTDTDTGIDTDRDTEENIETELSSEQTLRQRQTQIRVSPLLYGSFAKET